MHTTLWTALAAIIVGGLTFESSLASAQEPRPAEAARPQTRRPNRRPANVQPPAATGKVAAYEAEKAITVEVNQRGGQTRKADFVVAMDKTTIELVGDAKEVAVGMPVTVWADKDDAKLAVRIVAGQNNNPRPRRPGNRPANPAPPARPDAAPAPAPPSIVPPRPPASP